MEVSRTEILTNWLFCYFWKHHLSYSSVSSYNDIWMIIMRRTQCSMKNIKEWMIRNAFWITIYWKKKIITLPKFSLPVHFHWALKLCIMTSLFQFCYQTQLERNSCISDSSLAKWTTETKNILLCRGRC